MSKLFPKRIDFKLNNWQGEELKQVFLLIDNPVLVKKYGMTADVVSILHIEYFGKGILHPLSAQA